MEQGAIEGVKNFISEVVCTITPTPANLVSAKYPNMTGTIIAVVWNFVPSGLVTALWQ